MPKTVVRDNETLDDALRRFKRQVNKAGTLAESLNKLAVNLIKKKNGFYIRFFYAILRYR